MLPEPLLWYIVLRILVGVVAVGAIVAFLLTYLRRTTKHKGLLRTVSLIVLVAALVALPFVRSPLDYRTTAPAPADARLYAISNANDLYALRATDGSRTFIRHLPGAQGQLQYIAYDVDGLLIMSTPVYGFLTSTQSGVSTYVSVATMRAFHRDDGADALPALRAHANITASTVAGNVLYVTAFDDMAHRDAETLYAFSLPDGVELWHSAVTTTAQPSIWGIDQGMLYIQLDTTVAAVRTTDGALIWQSLPLATSYGHIESFAPPQAGGVYVRVTGDASNGTSVVKLDARDGSRIWTLPGVTFGAISGNRLYGVLTTNVTAFDISSGKQVWEQQGVRIQHPNADGAITTDSGVFYVVGQRTLPNGLPTSTCDVYAIRMSDNAELWRQPPHKCGTARSLLVANGILYYTTTAGDFTAFRAGDGGILWAHTGYSRPGLYTHWSDSFDVKAVVSGVAFIYSNHAGPCALLGGCDANYSGPCRLIVLCDDPNVGQYIEAVNPTTGRLYWRYRLDDIHSYILDERSP